jgi:NAD(P)-dependent dehydrogenase (short-subunit alcohol dehydrogenase family)
MSELFSVNSKVVHISGGSRGIGKAIALGLAEAGARVVVSARTEDALKATGLDYELCDVTDAAAVERTTTSIVARHGRLDVLFNVAGINFRHAAEAFPIDKFDDIMNVNVRGNFLMARASGRVMVEQRAGCRRGRLRHQQRCHRFHDPRPRRRVGPLQRAGQRPRPRLHRH